MSRLVRKFLPAVALLAASAAIGCSDGAQAPTAAAVAAPETAPRFNAADLDQIAKFRQKPQSSTGWAKKWIGPAGGRLDFLGFAIIVPPGAVDKVTMFSIQVPLDRTGSERVIAEFGPHNKLFAVPVTIEFPLANTTIDVSATPTVVWWNNGWVDIGAEVSPDGQKLRAVTPHFSTYGTTDLRGGGSLLISGG